MKASDLLVAALEAEGVTHVFGIPGEENLDLLESLRTSSIELVLVRHEQAAGFMAATYGRLTGCPGVCMATLGPGATNLVTAAAYAQLGGLPMLMITGQKPIKSSKQGRFQIVDVVDMMRSLTKYTHQIVSGDAVPTHVREAFRRAAEERPGAVHLELPEDIAREDSDMQVVKAARTRRPTAEEKSIRWAVELLEASRRPLLLIGAGANRKRTSRMLGQFVERTQIPFFTTQMGKGVLDERHPRFIGNAALSDHDFVHRAIDHADLIVNVGHDVVEKPPFFMHPDGRQVIHVNFSSAEIDPVYFPQVEVVGDVANGVWQIMERLRPQEHWEFERFMEIRRHLLVDIEEGAQEDRFPVSPRRLVADVRRAVPSDGIVTLDNGVYKIWFAREYPTHGPNTLLLDNALASMGAGLPSALAARLVHPDRKVVAVCGDGGFMMNSQELETAVRLGMDLVVVVLRDDAYGMIKWKQQDMEFGAYGLDFGNPDFVKYAEAYGAHGHRVQATAELHATLERCLSTPGVHLVEVPVDYSRNHALLHEEIPEKSRQI